MKWVASCGKVSLKFEKRRVAGEVSSFYMSYLQFNINSDNIAMNV